MKIKINWKNNLFKNYKEVFGNYNYKMINKMNKLFQIINKEINKQK